MEKLFWSGLLVCLGWVAFWAGDVCPFWQLKIVFFFMVAFAAVGIIQIWRKD